jgi:hypothetical protein
MHSISQERKQFSIAKINHKYKMQEILIVKVGGTYKERSL